MIIDVLSAAVSRRLVHLEAVKADLRLTDTSEDPRILEAIDVFTGEAIRLLGREPFRQEYRVWIPSDGGDYLKLPRWPAEQPSLVRVGLDSPNEVGPSAYRIADRHGESWWRWLFRSSGWAQGPTPSSLHYEINLWAGWASPVRRWEPSVKVRAGEYALASDRSQTGVFEAEDDGVTAGVEPEWVTEDGEATEDGSVSWVFRAKARPLPDNLHCAGIWAVKQLFLGSIGSAPAGVVSMRDGDHSRTFARGSESPDYAMPEISRKVLEGYRA